MQNIANDRIKIRTFSPEHSKFMLMYNHDRAGKGLQFHQETPSRCSNMSTDATTRRRTFFQGKILVLYLTVKYT